MSSGAFAPALGTYRFVGASASVTMTGLFVDEYGRRVGSMFTLSVTTSALAKFADVGGGIPDGAAGVMFNLTGDLRFGLLDSAGAAPTLADVQGKGIQWVAAQGPFAVGRVA